MKKKAHEHVVFAAADALFAETGREPSLVQVQERTGGSYSTVKPALELWKRRRVADLQLPPAPPGVVEKADLLAKAVWAIAKQQADQSFEAARQEALLASKEAWSQLAQAESEVSRLEQELSVIGERLAHALELLESERTHSRMHASRVEELRAEIQREVQNCEESRAAMHESEMGSAALKAECQGLRKQVSELLASVSAQASGRHRAVD